MYMYNWYHSSISGILYTHEHGLQCTTIHGAFPLLLSPLASSLFLLLCTPFYLLWTLLAVTGIVHLGLRLLVNWPSLPHPSPKPSPLQIPRTPTAQRLTRTTSGTIRLPLSGTLISELCPSLSWTALLYNNNYDTSQQCCASETESDQIQAFFARSESEFSHRIKILIWLRSFIGTVLVYKQLKVRFYRYFNKIEFSLSIKLI